MSGRSEFDAQYEPGWWCSRRLNFQYVGICCGGEASLGVGLPAISGYSPKMYEYRIAMVWEIEIF